MGHKGRERDSDKARISIEHHSKRVDECVIKKSGGDGIIYIRLVFVCLGWNIFWRFHSAKGTTRERIYLLLLLKLNERVLFFSQSKQKLFVFENNKQG